MLKVAEDVSCGHQELAGFSSLTAGDIFTLAEKSADISRLPGDFVAFDRTSGAAVSSFLSARPWYCAVSFTGRLAQGDNVFTVAREAKKLRKWNERAVQSLAMFGHTVGQDTLCEHIYRIPAGAGVS